MTVEIAGHIIFDKQCMIVNGFSTMDHDIVSFFKDFTERELEEKFEKILKLGVTTANSAGTVQNVDYIQKEFNNMLTTLDDRIEYLFGDRGEFSNKLKEHFGDNGKIVKDVFDRLRNEILEVKAQLAVNKGVQEVMKKTTLKGFDFETYCENILSNIARFHGDDLETTGTLPGRISKSMKGDYVVTLGNNIGKRIVFEVKNHSQQISSKSIHDELDEAKKNRDADYGVFVVKNVESIPKSIGCFNEINGGKLVCALGNEGSDSLLHVEILRIAYMWAKLKLSTDSLREKKIDVAFVNEKADAVLLKLNSFNQIDTECRNILKGAEEIKNIAQKTKADIANLLNDIIDKIDDP
jgi:hypothetical protein